MEPIDKKFQSPIISRIKVMSDLDIAERRVPQDGRFRLKIKDKTIDFRVSIMPCIYGEDAVIRILDKEMITEAIRELRLDVLGFSDEILKKFRKYIAQPYGMVLVTGPDRAAARRRRLYAALTEIKSPEDKIVTIEDPVEYQVDGITQIPVNEKKGLTFARGLRSILRHDPDKIMVGEIRDPETAQIAIQSALTGPPRLHDRPRQQRLRRHRPLPPHAGRPLQLHLGPQLHPGPAPRPASSARAARSRSATSADQLARIGARPRPPRRDRSSTRPRAAPSATFTGYQGRTAIAEILELSDPIRELILEKKPLSEVKKRAKAEGMIFLREVGMDKVLAGLTSLKDLNKVTFVE